MTTDSQVLTARSEYYAAFAACEAARAVKVKADADQLAAARLCEETLVRMKNAERRLLQLSAQKPAEPTTYAVLAKDGVTAKAVAESAVPPTPPVVPPTATPEPAPPRREGRRVHTS